MVKARHLCTAWSSVCGHIYKICVQNWLHHQLVVSSHMNW